MPLGRRSHKKSRNGCVSCKKRRIKCDEGKPICMKCLQHRIKCDFSEPPAPCVRKSSSPVPCQTFIQNREAVPSPAISFQSCSSLQPLPDDIDTTDFKLLHHFTTSTYRTLSAQAELQSVWQQQAPELAFSNTFLLRMMFAVSALHLCRTTSNTHYLPYAHQQYEAALRSSSVGLAAISPSNCHALYACAALGFIFELGASNNVKNVLYAADGALAHWTVHVRGVRTIIESSWHDLDSGVLSPLLHCESGQGGVENVETCLEQFAGHIQSAGIENERLSLYLEAIQELVKWSKMVEVGFFAWMCQISDGFLNLLAKKDPYALVIFAHSCVLLEHGEPKYWIGEWAKSLLSEVYECLDPPLRVWLEWLFTWTKRV